MSRPDLIASGIALVAALLAATTDLRRFRIPNTLTLPLLALGLLYHTAIHGLGGLFASGAGAVLGFVLLMPLFVLGGMGAGDVKLVAGLGAWLGPLATLQTLFVACLLTAAASFLLLSWQGRCRGQIMPREVVPRVEDVALHPERRGRLIPFGATVAAGLLASLAWAHWSP